MNIVKENIDDLNALLKVKVEKADYEERVEKTLKEYRKKANIKGFRPGMVPMGLIKKMYGLSVKADEINKVLSESVQKYLEDEKIDVLGDPLPKYDEEQKYDFEKDDDFDFTFEIGLSPEVDLKLSKKNKIKEYKIIVDDKMKENYVNNIARRYGSFAPGEKVEEKDMLKGDILSLNEDGTVNPDGISTTNSTLSVDVIKDNTIKTLFIGKEKGDVVDFDIKKAFTSDYEVAGLLQKKKDEIADVKGNFRFVIQDISRFHPAKIDNSLFDMVYGEGVVKTEEEFNERVQKEIEDGLSHETNYKLMLDLKDYVVSKTDIDLPEEFLKKWLAKINEKLTPEEIEKDFPNFKNDLKWQLIRNKIATDNNMTVTEEELQNEAQGIARYQFHQYGYYYVTDEQVANYAKEMLNNGEEAKRVAATILDNKVLDNLKEVVKIETKEISQEEFNKLFEK